MGHAHNELGDRLRHLQNHLGISSRKMALAIGMDPSQFLKTEKGQMNLPAEKIKEISSKWNISIDWLYNGTGDMVNKKEFEPVRHVENSTMANTSYIDQLIAAKDALLAEKDKRIEREQWFTDNVMTNFARYDQEIADYRKWQIEVGQSILSLTKAVAPLLGKDQKKAVGQQVGSKQRI